MSKESSCVLIRITDDKHRKFKSYCADAGTSMQSVIRQYIDKLLENVKK